MMKSFPKKRFRTDKSDGDLDKEARFYVLTKTNCPAVLNEVGFMDNLIDAKLLIDPIFQKQLATVIVNSFKQIEKTFKDI